MNVVLPYRHQVKPRFITGLDWGHPACTGLMACIPFAESAGAPMELVQMRIPNSGAILQGSIYGNAMPTADGTNNVFPSYGDVPAYDTTGDFTAACLLNVNAWSTGTSGDFFWGKNSFTTRGWILLNNGAFGSEVGLRIDRSATSNYAATTRAAVGTGLMLFIGRRTGLNLEFITVSDSGLTQHVNVAAGNRDTPAGADLQIGTTNANGDVQTLGCWLWNYPLADALLEDIYLAPWQMLRDNRARVRMVIYRTVSQTFTSLVEAKQGVASEKTSLVEAWQNLTVSKTMPVDAGGFVSRSISTPVEAGGSVAQSFTSLVEAKGGVSQSFSSLVEAKGSVFFSTWPATLPVRPLIDGWRESMPKTGARTSIEKFPQTQQQRSKAATWPLNQTLEVTSAQLDTLWTFYEETLGYGALSFTCPHPLTDEVVHMRFRGGEVPTASAIGWNTYHVSLLLEVMP